MMSHPVDVEHILRFIDDASSDWQQMFAYTLTDEAVKTIGQLFYFCGKELSRRQISTDDNEQSKLKRLEAEKIVLKLRELQISLGDRWPTMVKAFLRDTFNVGPYVVKAEEFFQPLQFYPGKNNIMKLFCWPVSDTNNTIVYRYYLEKSEMVPGQPYYVLGKCYLSGRHEQLMSYGSVVPNYNRMKIDVINDLNGRGPSPMISSLGTMINVNF